MNYEHPFQRLFSSEDKNVWDLILLFLSIKVAFFILAYLNHHLLPFNWSLYNVNLVRDIQDVPNFLRVFNTWDTQHYLFLADKGYGMNPMSNAFYPLFPFFIKLTSPLFGHHSLISALTLANLISLLIPVYMYKLVNIFKPSDQAFKATVLLLAFPTAFYLSVAYTEALFLALTLMAFYFLFQKEALKAGLCCFLLPLTRAQGLLMLAPILVLILKSILEQEGPLVKKVQTALSIYVIPIVASVSGMGCYFLIMKYQTGEFMMGINAQGLFVAGNSIANVFNPYDWFVRNFIDIKLSLHGYNNSVIDRVSFLIFLPVLVGIFFTEHKALFLYAAIMMLIPALSGTFMSYTRFLLVVFPIAMLLSKNPRFFLPLSLGMFVLQVFFYLGHTGGYWVA